MGDLESADFENPNPSIHDLFTYYNQVYFEGKLGPCTLQWSSKRMTLCAGVCQYSTYGGCEIRLSEPLLKYRPVSDLKNTLLHEMIHAYLFLTKGNKDHDDHGPCFQHMMMMINNFDLIDEERPEDGYAVTIYHNFTNEVDLYRTHHWRCLKCSDLIKRAMNRTPSASDCISRSDACVHPRCHWHMHQNRCGGSYEKIQEPAGYVDKRKRGATLASTENRIMDSDGDDTQLTQNGQKRKMNSNGGPSKKATKEPPAQVKTGSLDNYFVQVPKDEGNNGCTPTVDKDDFSENPAEDQNTSPGEISGKRKFAILNDFSQKESRSDTTEEGKEVGLGSQVSPRKKGQGSLLLNVGSTQMEESCGKGLVEGVGKNLGSKRRAPASVSQGKEIVVGTTTRQRGPGVSGESPSRKKYKKVDDLLKKQTCKEPLVILAWANWMSYESDEVNEEPLINRRTERRKKEWNSELLKKGKTVLDPTEGTELVTAEEPLCVDENPKESSPSHASEERVPNGHINQVVVIDDAAEDIIDSKHIFIELSDDEKLLDATAKKSNDGKGQTANNLSFVPEKALLDLKDLEKQDVCHNSPTSTRRRGRSATAEGNFTSPLGDRPHRKDQSATESDIMTCPICNLTFRGNERYTVVTKHVDECLAQCA